MSTNDEIVVEEKQQDEYNNSIVPQVVAEPVDPSDQKQQQQQQQQEGDEYDRGQYCEDCGVYTVHELNGQMACFGCGSVMEENNLVSTTEFTADGQVRLFSLFFHHLTQPSRYNYSTGHGTICQCNE